MSGILSCFTVLVEIEHQRAVEPQHPQIKESNLGKEQYVMR